MPPFPEAGTPVHSLCYHKAEHRFFLQAGYAGRFLKLLCYLQGLKSVTGKIIYVLADTRSGSTLLDQLLGAHDKIISLGEVHHLVAYARQDRSLYNPAHPLVCSCGEFLNACAFWRQVETELGRPLASLTLEAYGKDRPQAGWQARLYRVLRRTLMARNPRVYRNPAVARLLGSARVAADSFDLFDAIFRQHGDVRYLVDSSKSAYRFQALHAAKPDSVVALVLVRDYRGTVYSKMKRGQGLENSARRWVRQMERIRKVTEGLPRQQLVHVRYEELCSDPQKELARLCRHLGLPFSEQMLTRPRSHHLGGSPSKFDPGKMRIELDDAYTRAFCDKELAELEAIAGKTAAQWGYS